MSEAEPRPHRLGLGWRAALVAGGAASLGAAFLGSGVAGTRLDPEEVSLGPLDAEISLNFENRITFDLGPLGEGLLPIDAPLHLGTEVDVKADPSLPGANGQFNVSQEDVERYARLFGSIDSDIENARTQVLHKFLLYGSLGAGTLGVVGLGLYASYGQRRRAELYDYFVNYRSRPRARAAMGGGAAALLLAGCLVAVPIASAEPNPQAVAVGDLFADTNLPALEELHATGPLAPLLTEVAPRIIDVLEENDAFYDQVIGNLRLAFEQEYTLRPADHQHMIMFYSDLHCNIGMARVIGELGRLAKTTLVVDGGDTTMSGSSFEEPCIRLLEGELPSVPKVVSPGNHDSDITEEQYQQHGFTVLNGKPEEVRGLHILGDADPMRSPFVTPKYQVGSEDHAAVAERLSRVACSEPVDLLVVHDPAIARQVLATGCVGAAMSGHSHKQEIQLQPLLIVADNASGARGESPSLGPLQTATHLYLLKANAETGVPSFYQVFTINPDTTVTIERPVQLPLRPPINNN